MKPLGLFSIVDAKGHKMDDSSALVMLLLNMCTAAPSTLIDNRIQWTQVDTLAIKATFNDRDTSVSGDKYQKVKWSTFIKMYKDVNCNKLSTYGEAVWHFPDGDSCYGKLNLKELEYNCTQYK